MTTVATTAIVRTTTIATISKLQSAERAETFFLLFILPLIDYLIACNILFQTVFCSKSRVFANNLYTDVLIKQYEEQRIPAINGHSVIDAKENIRARHLILFQSSRHAPRYCRSQKPTIKGGQGNSINLYSSDSIFRMNIPPSTKAPARLSVFLCPVPGLSMSVDPPLVYFPIEEQAGSTLWV